MDIPLPGPVEPAATDGCRCSWTFSESLKWDRSRNREACCWCCPVWEDCVRSDNEFPSNEFESLLSQKANRRETSTPYPPHQSGTAERNWRTSFEMARCVWIESKLPKELWKFAVQQQMLQRAAEQTPYEVLSGKRPDLAGWEHSDQTVASLTRRSWMWNGFWIWQI